MTSGRYLPTCLGFRPASVTSRSIRCRGALIVWVLPALAVLAGATYWLLTAPISRSSGPNPTASMSFAAVPVPRPSKAPDPSSSTKDGTGTIQPPSHSVTAASPSVPAKRARRTDAKLPDTKPLSKGSAAGTEKALLGEWSGYYQGQRKLKVSADGSGTIVARPDGLAATLLAAELTFQIRWVLKDDQLEFETVGGEPLDKVNVVVKMYGRLRSHKILELQPDKMVLLDEDGVTKYLWTRVTSEPHPATAPAK